jgi:hypothetical protein
MGRRDHPRLAAGLAGLALLAAFAFLAYPARRASAFFAAPGFTEESRDYSPSTVPATTTAPIPVGGAGGIIVFVNTDSVSPGVASLRFLADPGRVLTVQGGPIPAGGYVLFAENAYGPVEDAGRANPDYNFRYDPLLGGTGGYIFNLSTSGLGTGTYVLGFRAGGDPTVYTVQLKVK